MRLYHGTSAEAIEDILKIGIVPISIQEDGKSNWSNTVQSHVDHVYLTECYAPYFAHNASTISDDDIDRSMAIVEIDTNFLDADYFYPDEDFIAQFLVQHSKIKPYCLLPLDHVTRMVRDNIEDYKEAWRESLEHLGNISYKGSIPRSAITKIAVFDPKTNPEMLMMALDPTISILNHRFCADKYKMLTTWFMGEIVTVEDYLKNMPFPMDMMNTDGLAEILSNQAIEIILPDK